MMLYGQYQVTHHEGRPVPVKAKKKAAKRKIISDRVYEYLALKSQAAMISARVDTHRKDLMETLTAEGETDERGHQRITLDEPIEMSVYSPSKGEWVDQVVNQVKRQKNVSNLFLEDEAMTLLEEKNLVKEATKTVTFVDQDALYALQQEGKISEAELRALFEPKITYSLVTTA